MEEMVFQIGPIRPPSEANSLLLLRDGELPLE